LGGVFLKDLEGEQGLKKAEKPEFRRGAVIRNDKLLKKGRGQRFAKVDAGESYRPSRKKKGERKGKKRNSHLQPEAGRGCSGQQKEG